MNPLVCSSQHSEIKKVAGNAIDPKVKLGTGVDIGPKDMENALAELPLRVDTPALSCGCQKS